MVIENTESAPKRPAPSAVLAFLASPITMIAGVLLVVAMWATPFYLRTMEQEIFEGEIYLSICSGFSKIGQSNTPRRPPLL